MTARSRLSANFLDTESLYEHSLTYVTKSEKNINTLEVTHNNIQKLTKPLRHRYEERELSPATQLRYGRTRLPVTRAEMPWSSRSLFGPKNHNLQHGTHGDGRSSRSPATWRRDGIVYGKKQKTSLHIHIGI